MMTNPVDIINSLAIIHFPGDFVEHESFGYGIIESMCSNEMEYVVDFGAGTKVTLFGTLLTAIKPVAAKYRPKPPREIWTAKQVAAHFQLKESTVLYLVKTEKLDSCLIGGQIRFRKRDIDAYTDSRIRAIGRNHEDVLGKPVNKKANKK